MAGSPIGPLPGTSGAALHCTAWNCTHTLVFHTSAALILPSVSTRPTSQQAVRVTPVTLRIAAGGWAASLMSSDGWRLQRSHAPLVGRTMDEPVVSGNIRMMSRHHLSGVNSGHSQQPPQQPPRRAPPLPASSATASSSSNSEITAARNSAVNRGAPLARTGRTNTELATRPTSASQLSASAAARRAALPGTGLHSVRPTLQAAPRSVATGSLVAPSRTSALATAPRVSTLSRPTNGTAASRPTVPSSSLARLALRAPRHLARPARPNRDDSDSDDDDGAADFPMPASYVESKRMAAAEEALREARAARAAAAAATAAPSSATPVSASRMGAAPLMAPRSHNSSASSLHSLASAARTATSASSSVAASSSLSIAPAAASASGAVSSPNARRRLSRATGVSASSSASSTAATGGASSSYASGIAQLERRYERQSSATAAATAAASAAASSAHSRVAPVGAVSGHAAMAGTNRGSMGAGSGATAASAYQHPRPPSATLSSSLSSAPSSSAASFSTAPPRPMVAATPSPYRAAAAEASDPGASGLGLRRSGGSVLPPEMQRFRSEWRSDMQQRAAAHEQRARAQMREAEARSYDDRMGSSSFVHPLMGLAAGPASSAASSSFSSSSIPASEPHSSSSYSYADRGAQLASLARQAHAAPMRPGLGSSMLARSLSGELASSSASSLSSAGSALRPYETERLEVMGEDEDGDGDEDALRFPATTHLFAMQSHSAQLQRRLAQLTRSDDGDVAAAAALAVASQRERERVREQQRRAVLERSDGGDPHRLTRQGPDHARAQRFSEPPRDSGDVIRARVDRLQSQIHSELDHIGRSRSGGGGSGGVGAGPGAGTSAGSVGPHPAPAPPSRSLVGARRGIASSAIVDAEERKSSWDISSASDDSDWLEEEEEEEKSDGGSDDDRWPGRAAAVPSHASTSSSSSIPPPRAQQRVQANFSPYVPAAERLRLEAAGMSRAAPAPASAAASAAAPIVDPLASALDDARARVAAFRANPSPYEPAMAAPAAAAAAPVRDASVLIGSLSVRIERADALRQEMLFLSSLFDSVRSYQSSLVQSLRDAGFVDEGVAAALPGLNGGLVHFLIESAWGAVARQAALDANGDAAAHDAEKRLPHGHAERVAALPSTTLAHAAADDCCICLDAMGVGAVVSHLDLCSHQFHSSCIRQWLAKANSCPLCKRVAIEDPADAAPAAAAPLAAPV